MQDRAVVPDADLAVRHLVEGSFGFFDVLLIILTAILFMNVLKASGVLDSLAAALLRTFYRRKALLLLTSMLLVMFPGMITGSSLAVNSICISHLPSGHSTSALRVPGSAPSRSNSPSSPSGERRSSPTLYTVS